MQPPTEHLMTLREAIESKATEFYWKTDTLECQIQWHWDPDEIVAAWEDDEPTEEDE